MSGRDAAVDRLRGLVMVLMALDHARDFFHDARRDPTDLATTTPALFFTRFVTHYCAPVFILLAGAAAFLQLERATKREVSKFLLVRGAWLVFLELTVVRIAWSFDPRFRFAPLQVIWAIGWSMIALAAFVHLPRAATAAISIVGIAAHDLLHRTSASALSVPEWLFKILHQHGAIHPAPSVRLYVVYPLVPWIFVMALGMSAIGPILSRDAASRRRTLLAIGTAATVAFVLLRLVNRYGDPTPWSMQRTATFTLLSFLDVEKYPPSLAYLLVTLGPSLLLLVALERVEGRLGALLETFGRVPLFYYVLHLYLLHAAAVVTNLALRGSYRGGPPFSGSSVGLSLPWVYVAWIAALALLLPACRWYAALLARRRDVWLLRYL